MVRAFFCHFALEENRRMAIIFLPAAGDGSPRLRNATRSSESLHGGSPMSHTLNLVAGLLSAARNLADLGRDQSAVELLQRLGAFRDLAPRIAEEVHRRLADLHAARDQYKDARRHLTIAITYAPHEGSYHHRMGRWIEADPDATSHRAARYYRCAVSCDPDNADYWADYGTHLLTVGRIRAGHRVLCRAFDLASHDPEHVGRIAGALRAAELWDEARQLLRRAVFQSGRDRRFRALWQQHQFEQLSERHAVDAVPPAPRREAQPVVLAFVRDGTPAGPRHVDGKIIRFDRAADSVASRLPLPKRNPRTPRRRETT
jgi:tetratricopeptide (TPR) repeat protein